MHTRRIDAALDALARCRAHLPPLRDLYPADSRQHAALDQLLEAVARTQAEVFDPKAPLAGAGVA